MFHLFFLKRSNVLRISIIAPFLFGFFSSRNRTIVKWGINYILLTILILCLSKWKLIQLFFLHSIKVILISISTTLSILFSFLANKFLQFIVPIWNVTRSMAIMAVYSDRISFFFFRWIVRKLWQLICWWRSKIMLNDFHKWIKKYVLQ